MPTSSRPWRALLAAAVVSVACATTVAVPTTSTPTAAASSPCGPLGWIREYELNDRCNYGLLDPTLITDSALLSLLRQAGLFATLTLCLGQGFSTAPVVAIPDELLVAASDSQRLGEAVAEVSGRLNGAVIAVTTLNPFAATLSLRPGTLNEAFLRQVIPTLQGRGFSTDLNYLEPALPYNGFRPADNPVPAVKPVSGAGGSGSVLVVDSPSNGATTPGVTTIGPPVEYDVDGNGLVDEDHGHGVYVASLIKRLAPTAKVELAGVNGGHLATSARWSPMVFSDADVIAAMGAAFGLSAGGVARPFDVVNLSLGGAGCAGIGSRLALGRFLRDLADLSAATTGVRPVYVAAAGNDGGDVKHFPAAWRDGPTMDAAALAVDLVSPPGVGDEVRAIHAALRADILAVGSRTDGTRDSFSNCGAWVNAVAAGKNTVARYPSPPSATGFARWSGTSFATARVSAAVADGQGITDVLIGNAVGNC
jgi:Subtilase family